MTDPNRDAEIEAWRQRAGNIVAALHGHTVAADVLCELIGDAMPLMRRAPAAPSQPQADVALAIAELKALGDDIDKEGSQHYENQRQALGAKNVFAEHTSNCLLSLCNHFRKITHLRIAALRTRLNKETP